MNCRHSRTAHAVQKPRIGITNRWVCAAIACHGSVPGRPARGQDRGVIQLRTVQRVAVQINGDLIAFFKKPDRPPDSSFRSNMTNHQADRPPRETTVSHQTDDNAALPAKGGDAGCRIQHFRHPRTTYRPFVANDNHVRILEMVGISVEHLKKRLLTVKNLCGTCEDIVLETAFHARKFQHSAEFRRQVAAKHPQTTRRLVRLGNAADHIAVRRRRVKARHLLGKGLAGTGQGIPIEQPGIHQIADKYLNAALRIDINHREAAKRTRIDNHRDDLAGQMVEFLGAHHVAREVAVTGGAGNLWCVKHHIGRPADRHRHNDGVADGFAGDNVTRLDVVGDHVVEIIDQLIGEFGQAAFVLRRWRDHVKRLHTDNTNEGLHGVVGEHATTASKTRTGFKSDTALQRFVIAAGKLVAGDDVDRLTGGGVGAGPDRTVRHDDRRTVMLEDRGKRADRRLVTGNDGNHPFEARCTQMFA